AVQTAAGCGGGAGGRVRAVRVRRGTDEAVGARRAPVGRPAGSPAGQAVVRAHVRRAGGLPLDVGIHGGGACRAHELVAKLALRLRVARLERDVLQIVSERLVTGLAIRRAELQVREPQEALEEPLP